MEDSVKEGTCPQCGSVLPSGVLEGLCPACLMNQATETQSRGGQVSRFVPPGIEEIGALFPQLTILQLLGAGGMGAVYKARQPGLDRFVALKVLPPNVAGGVNFAERFNREARALARLSHPNIVTVHEFGQAGRLNYFIMEYVDGTNLRQLTQNARLSPREALQIIPQICDALQYAHDEGVVHRDIKPENVLVDRKGRVKIADFGLAKMLDADLEAQRLTVEGQVMGTPHYMAPEQVERPLTVDHRADIYSLGVVFYELLTGDLPLGKFPPPSRKVSVDVRLDEVVLRALENDPARRYQHASEVKSELQTICDTPAVATAAPAAPRQQTTERYIRWAGFPVVVERNGEREVSWNGAINLILTAMLLHAFGLLLFRLIAGYHFPGSLAIPIVATIFIISAGLRAALNAPDEVPEMTNKGTLVLAPKHRLRLTRSHLALGSVVMLVLGWALFQQFLLPRLVKPLFAKSRAAQTAVMDSATGLLYADLPGRGRAEVVAIGYRDPAPNGWWRPDGTRITNELFEVENISEALFMWRTNRDMLTRTWDLPEGASGPFYEFEPAIGYGGGGCVFRNGSPAQGIHALRLAVEPSLRSVTMRMGLGLKEWRTIATRQARGQSTTSSSTPGDPNWNINFHDVTETTEGAQVTLIQAKEDRNWTRRIVAVDTNNVMHSYNLGSGTPSGDASTWTYKFNKLPLAQLKEFLIQVRPVHWVEFPKVLLNPRQPVPLARPATYTAVQERTFEDYIDFDSGEVREFPSSERSGHLLDVSDAVAWMERNGLDAGAGNGGIQPLGMIFAALSTNEWENLPPHDLIRRIYSGQFRPRTLAAGRNELPATFGFRTREGGTGILQLVALPEDRPVVALRYKLVKKPALE